MTFARNNTLLVTSYNEHCVQRIHLHDLAIDDYCGKCGKPGWLNNGVHRTEIRLHWPVGVTYDRVSKIYISEKRDLIHVDESNNELVSVVPQAPDDLRIGYMAYDLIGETFLFRYYKTHNGSTVDNTDTEVFIEGVFEGIASSAAVRWAAAQVNRYGQMLLKSCYLVLR